ncbi:MAG: hypothetical protein DWH96_02990 [Planctomycetota bacterium]|nr:MAG: hypothetical protein DWH96_02990 [Planctomycetota bacterium]
MKFVWIVIVALLFGGAVLFLLPTSTNNAAPLAPLLPRTSHDPPPITIAPTPLPQPTIIDAPIATPPAVTQEIIHRIDAQLLHRNQQSSTRQSLHRPQPRKKSFAASTPVPSNSLASTASSATAPKQIPTS